MLSQESNDLLSRPIFEFELNDDVGKKQRQGIRGGTARRKKPHEAQTASTLDYSKLAARQAA